MIVPLNKITLAGMIVDKAALLDDLQRLGCVELIPQNAEEAARADPEPRRKTREALRFLKDCPYPRSQVLHPGQFDALAVERQVLKLQDHMRDLEQERDFLIVRLQEIEAWGEFEFPSLEEMDGWRLWFYKVPHKDVPALRATGVACEIIKRHGRFTYVVAVSREEPLEMPVARTHLGARSRAQVAARLEKVELALEDGQARRAYLSRWRTLLERNLEDLEAIAVREDAAKQTCDDDPVFALQGWAPKASVGLLREYAAKRKFFFEAVEPAPDESPPTLMQNRPALSAGESLVNFYMTPGYRTWDPSATVFISFAIFFAMIMADAGYSLALGACLLLFWKKMGRSPGGQRMRALLVTILGFSLVYGVIIGSYFGLSPRPASFLKRLQILDINNANAMMALAICVGALHVILANLMNARRYHWRAQGLCPLGWACIVGGGLTTAAGGLLAVRAIEVFGPVLMIGGALLVFGFAGCGRPAVSRYVQGALALTKITSAFGDVLSYLRLFALGLASASLALAFNDMARQMYRSVPIFGLLLAIVFFALGHGLNLLLGISGGVIHGLRLNVIEFFNWGLPEEGRLFKAFKR